ncbi:C2 domain-containing protein 2-like [Homarus americanus]|uniref:C2 domain-containing protein 2-like n=1 Tax=Homarus americanus TaxID=6706 RepID=A0A8J5JYZ9_HOMAM|nr:C2 domain-containing protein 2-like [Homarus americanus]
MCFNEFTESLFRHIELEELEISIPEEVTEDPALEMAEIYETNDKSLIVSETSDWESGEIEEETDNEIENLETTLDSHEDTADDVESDDSLSTDVSQHQNFEPKKLYLETDFGVFNADTNTRILSTNCGVDEIIASRHHNELYKDSDTPSEEEVARQYGYTELKESSFEESNGSFTDNCDDSLQEKDDLSRVTDNRTPESPFIMEETTNTSNVDKRLDEKNVTDEIYIMKIEDNAVVKETNDLEFHEQLTQEQGVNSNTVAEVAPYMKLQEDLHSIVSFCQTPSSSLQTIDSNLTANDSQKIMDNKLNLTDKKLEEGEYDKNLDIKINPTTEVNAQDPFSPAEDDFIFHNDEDITNGTQDESRCDYDYALLESSSSDSEVEGITGKYSGKELNDSLQGRSLSGKNWRNSDIELIMEAESFVIPNDHVSTTLGCEVKDVQELPEDDSLGKNLKDAHGLSQDNVLNTSQKDAQIVPQISLLNHNLKDTQDSLQEAPGIEVQSNILTFSEGSMLTTKTGSVAPLTQPDTTCALTLQQGTSHTRKEYTTGDDFMKDASFTSGQHHWTRPLPTHPVYGTSYVVSALPSTTTGQSMGIPGLNGKRLLVKIVKATSVGCDKSVCEAYAVVEMDEPPQKFTTSVVKDTSSPFWDEQFLFDLSGGTLELLFEVYDKKDGNFLGLGIVGIEELVATPSQRQIIPLQSRPYENDEVSGSLTVEFLFLDRADLPEHTLRSSATSQSLTSKGDLITTTTTTYVKAPELQVVVGVGSSSPGTYRRRESYRKANNIRSGVQVSLRIS